MNNFNEHIDRTIELPEKAQDLKVTSESDSFFNSLFQDDYEKKEIVFVQNPNFNPNAKYKTEGLEYDESQNQVTKVNSRAL